MDVYEKVNDQSRCGELAMSSSFYRRIYSEIEEVGWQHLVRLGENLTFLCFRVMDCEGRAHILEITLDEMYPRHSPSVSVSVPYNFTLEWTSNSKLRDVVQQFRRHVDRLKGFLSAMDNIDQSPWVIDAQNSRHATSTRQIRFGNDCTIILSINVNDPLSLPECRFVGSEDTVNSLRETWKRNCKRWVKGEPFLENFARIFDTQLLQIPSVQNIEGQVECGICYAQFLPIDDELGSKSGGKTDCTCENGHCNRAFHSICLVDWLRSITTTRQSFDVLFGNCPYCSDPIAVKISDR